MMQFLFSVQFSAFCDSVKAIIESPRWPTILIDKVSMFRFWAAFTENGTLKTENFFPDPWLGAVS